MALFANSGKVEYGPLAHDDNQPRGSRHHIGGDNDLALPRQKFTRTTLTLATALGVVVGLVLGYVASTWSSTSRPSLHDLGINPNTPIPTDIFKLRRDVAFTPHREYMGPSKEAARNWYDLTAASDSIYIPSPSHYGLTDPGIRAPFFIFNDPPPSAAEDETNLRNFFVLNNLHELHCVHMIRMRYNSLVYEADTTNPLADTPIDVDWIDHVEHCFEYLRLSITCGDHMTLETDSPPGSPREYWEDGLSWGVVHSCIDWEGLMSWQGDMVVAYNETWSG